LDTLVGDVIGGQSVMIISPSRYGKTSLAVQARERLVRERVLVAYDLFALGDTLVRIDVEAAARGCTTEAAARRLADETRARMTARAEHADRPPARSELVLAVLGH
jgi:hypothetical protein